MAFPLSFPAIEPATVHVVRRRATAISQSPFTFAQQVVAHAGELWVATFRYPPLAQADAITLGGFLEELSGQVGTFTVDLSDYVPWVEDMDAVTMRLVSPDYEYSLSTVMHWGFSFVAMEAVTA